MMVENLTWQAIGTYAVFFGIGGVAITWGFAKEALQKPSLILRPESFYLLHRPNFCANDCSGYF